MKQYFNLKEIPATKSDRMRKDTTHYILKKTLIKWLITNDPKVLESHYHEYDAIKIQNEQKGATFQPDVAYVRTQKNQTWIEIETDRFNVFNKIAKLLFCSLFPMDEWPIVLIFGIEDAPAMKPFVDIFDDLCKKLTVEDKRLYSIDLETRKIRRWR